MPCWITRGSGRGCEADLAPRLNPESMMGRAGAMAPHPDRPPSAEDELAHLAPAQSRVHIPLAHVARSSRGMLRPLAPRKAHEHAKHQAPRCHQLFREVRPGIPHPHLRTRGPAVGDHRRPERFLGSGDPAGRAASRFSSSPPATVLSVACPTMHAGAPLTVAGRLMSLVTRLTSVRRWRRKFEWNSGMHLAPGADARYGRTGGAFYELPTPP